jgi:dTDP-4-amino-4,6-dideoxygalactose transaminase
MQLPDWPAYSAEEIAIAGEVLASGKVNYWTGEHGKAFEQEYADYCGVGFGIAVANGSVGIGAVLHALDIGPGDEVIVSPRSFFASAAEIVLVGATPVFAEVDRDSQNISAASISAALTDRTRAIICVHLAGWPCDMPAICELARARNIFVIEDCAQAHGAEVDGRPVGSWGDAGVFSFCQDKIMSTGGEGGMVVTADEALFDRIWSFKDHGKSLSTVNSKSHPPGFRWLHESFGTNLRMTEVQAAIGRHQLKKLDDWVDSRRRNATLLNDAFAGLEVVRLPLPPANIKHSYYKYYLFVRNEMLREGWSRDRILDEFAHAGITSLSGSCPEIYREKAFRGKISAEQPRLPVARELGEASIMFMVHPTIEAHQLQALAGVAKGILQQAQR